MKNLPLILCLFLFSQTAFAQKVTVILGREDLQCASNNPWPCQTVLQMDLSEARAELQRLSKVENPTRDEQKMLAALNVSLGTLDAVAEPQFEVNTIQRGVRRPLQRSN